MRSPVLSAPISDSSSYLPEQQNSTANNSKPATVFLWHHGTTEQLNNRNKASYIGQ
jgi:hypothetical protein